MVDDPRDFGRIAATNAISDVYAMGGTPIFALAILGMPVDRMPTETVRAILAGGSEACAGAGIPVAGGHSIDTPEPIYGLAVIGLCHPAHIRRNTMARPGDALILTKPLGVGVYSAALRTAGLDDMAYAEMIATTTRLNRVGIALAQDDAVHAMTDVTGFGVLGHGLEVARGSRVTVEIEAGALPLLRRATEWVGEGHVTGASRRNWAAYGAEVVLPDGLPETMRHLLTDPQTSGGLLVSCDARASLRILGMIQAAGHPEAAIVGRVSAGAPVLRVQA